MARPIIPTFRGVAAMRFSVLAADCVRHLVQAKGYSPETEGPYTTAANQFVSFLHHQQLDDDTRAFTEDNVLAFQEYLGGLGAHPNTIRQKLFALRAIARHGLRKKQDGRPILAADPTATLEFPTVQKANVEIPTPKELRDFLAVPITPRQQLARDLLIDTGLRASELCRARIEDLRETPGGVYLAVTVKGRGARQQQRDIPLSDPVVRRIHEQRILRDLAGPEDHILVRENGKAMNKHALHHLVTSIAHKAGVTRFSLSPHKFRHLVNSLGKMAGVDPHTRSRMLNHANLSSLQSYDHLMPGELFGARRATSAAFERYVGRTPEAPATVPTPADPAMAARVAELLATMPADRLEAALAVLRTLATPIHCTPESPALRPNADAEKANSDAGSRRV